MESIPLAGKGKFVSVSSDDVWRFLGKQQAAILRNKDGRKTRVFMDRDELPKNVLQDGANAYIVTKQFMKAMQNGNRCYNFNLTVLDERNGKSRIPWVVSIVTNRDIPDPLVDSFYNGKTHVPVAIFSYPGEIVGQRKNHLCNEYSRIEQVTLRDMKKKVLLPNAMDLEKKTIGYRNLLSFNIPASYVQSFFDSIGAEKLIKALDTNDWTLVKEINTNLEEKHRAGCLGTHSCINKQTFELVMPEYYPRYNLTVDLEGKIYDAKRVVPEKS